MVLLFIFKIVLVISSAKREKRLLVEISISPGRKAVDISISPGRKAVDISISPGH